MKENKILIEKLLSMVKEERRLGVEILEVLLEIEKRKAYSELGYDGLFSFCVKELKYSEAQAYRRIQAMYAMKQNPKLKEKMKSGELSVTTVSQVQTYLRQNQNTKKAKQSSTSQNTETTERETFDEKLDFFNSFANQSAKQVQEKLNTLKGEENSIKLVISLNEEMQAHWNQIKNLSAHQTKGQDQEVLLLLMKAWLSKAEKVKTDETNDSKKSNLQRTSSCLAKVNPDTRPAKQSDKKHIPIDIALQYDHCKPHAMGGQTTEENLRLLCRNCNLYFGIRYFGVQKMRRETHQASSNLN